MNKGRLYDPFSRLNSDLSFQSFAWWVAFCVSLMALIGFITSPIDHAAWVKGPRVLLVALLPCLTALLFGIAWCRKQSQLKYQRMIESVFESEEDED